MKIFEKVLATTCPHLFPDIPLNDIKQLTHYITHLNSHKGAEFCIRYLKATEEEVLKFVFANRKCQRHEKVSIGLDQNA
jgi:hypothetical protein